MRRFTKLRSVVALFDTTFNAPTQKRLYEKFLNGLVKEAIKHARLVAKDFWTHHTATSPGQVFRVVPCKMVSYAFDNSDELITEQASSVVGICSVINTANKSGPLPDKVIAYSFDEGGELVEKQPIFVAGAKQLYWFDLTYRQSGARLIRVTSDYVEEIAYWCNECLGGDWTLALVKLLGKSLDFDNNGKLYSNFAGGKWLLFAMDDADLALFKIRWMLA
jgi:hypothetical protein